jgi:hypothetical protein
MLPCAELLAIRSQVAAKTAWVLSLAADLLLIAATASSARGARLIASRVPGPAGVEAPPAGFRRHPGPARRRYLQSRSLPLRPSPIPIFALIDAHASAHAAHCAALDYEAEEPGRQPVPIARLP